MNIPFFDTLPPAVQEALAPLVQLVMDNSTVAIVAAAVVACLAAWKVLAD